MRYEPLIASLAATDAVCFWFTDIHDDEFAGFRKPLYAARIEMGTRVAFGGRMDHSMLEHEMAADYGAVRELTARTGRPARGRARVRVTTPGGTDCTFDVTGASGSSTTACSTGPAHSATCRRARSSSRRSPRAPRACA